MDERRTKKQLLAESRRLRSRVAELEAERFDYDHRAAATAGILAEVLRLATQDDALHDIMRATATRIREWLGCDAVGIRLREGEDFPYFETSGFASGFVEHESRLCAVDQRGELIRDSRGSWQTAPPSRRGTPRSRPRHPGLWPSYGSSCCTPETGSGAQMLSHSVSGSAGRLVSPCGGAC